MHLQLGLLHARQARLSDAEARYQLAPRLDSLFVPALANLALVLLERAHQRAHVLLRDLARPQKR